MNAPAATEPMEDQRISEALEQQSPRLRNWIRRHVANPAEVEDVLQDVFFELVLAYRLTKPIEHVGAWLFQVARNRITDLFRRQRPEALAGQARVMEDGGSLSLEDLLPSPDAYRNAATVLRVLLRTRVLSLCDAVPIGWPL